MARFRIDMAPAPTLPTLRPLLAALALLLLGAPLGAHATGYSYTRFVGPVRGPEQKILVHDALNGGARVDFIAKPAYEFAYGVEDSRTRVLQNRHETRDGDAVKGVYSVVDPDGSLRVVKYTADHLNGFQAEVITNGLAAAVHGQPPQHADSVAHYVQTGPRQQQEVHHHAGGAAGGGGYDAQGVYEGGRMRTRQRRPVAVSSEAQAEDGEEDEGEDEEEEEAAEDGEYEDEASGEAQSNEERSNEYY